ncbi:MAG: hypothetical protein ACOC3I_01345 [Verrucomicrobiota bacterium]
MIKKLLLILLAGVLVVFGLLFFFGGSLLNKGVHRVVEELGPRLTGTTVTLEEVDISLSDGQGALRGLLVGNPEGYSTEKAMSLGEIELRLVPSSLTGDHIVIERITITAPSIVLEQKGRTSNLQQIQQNIAEFTAREEPDVPTEEPSTVRLEIKEFIITDAAVEIQALGSNRQVSLPTIRLSNLGTEEGGVPPGEIAGEVLDAIIRAATRKAAEVGMNFIQDPQGNLDAARSSLENLRENAGSTLRGFLGGGSEQKEEPSESPAPEETPTGNGE